MIPEKLKYEDEIRIISPAISLSIIAPDQQKLSIERLKDLGFNVTFSTYSSEEAEHLSTPIEHRVEDLHDAFKDPNVKAILSTIGGYDSNQLLSSMDFELIKQNPKIFCGYSDITALSNSIYKKTGLVTYSGPHFSSFGMEKGFDYTMEHFKHMFTKTTPIDVLPAEHWSDDHWYIDQENRTFHPNDGYGIIHEGSADGTVVGGNLCTLNLLHGTDFMPSLENTILFLEDDMLSDPPTFDRNLQSLIHQPGFDGVKGIVIGRFQEGSQFESGMLERIIESKKELKNLPIITNASFGHTTPIFTFPIGGKVKMEANRKRPSIEIYEY